jgi:hypothetical protein
VTELIQETGGIAPGAIYCVDGDYASMVWSPNWRSEVPEHQRQTHLGVVGQATVTGWPSDVVEKALNHTIGGVRGVYNRAEYAPQRQEMLQFWADYIDQLMGSGQVILGRFKQVA